MKVMEIKICPNCEGQGTSEIRSRDGYDKVQCQRCAGSGRVLTKTYTVEIAFGSDVTGFYDADSTIVKTIQNIKR